MPLNLYLPKPAGSALRKRQIKSQDANSQEGTPPKQSALRKLWGSVSFVNVERFSVYVNVLLNPRLYYCTSFVCLYFLIKAVCTMFPLKNYFNPKKVKNCFHILCLIVIFLSWRCSVKDGAILAVWRSWRYQNQLSPSSFLVVIIQIHREN